MKKYYLLALLLVGALALVGCNKQEPIEVLEPVVLLEEKPVEVIEEVVEVVEPSEYCVDLMVESYRGGFDIKKSRVEAFDLNSYETAIITAKFTEYFIDNYRYEDSDKFFFGLKLFVGNHTDNGGYYNVLRARTEGLANWNYLTGLVTASELNYFNGFTWTIPLKEDIYVASKTFVEGRQFIKINMSDYTKDSNYIGAYLSAVKELGGWELADISIKLCK